MKANCTECQSTNNIKAGIFDKGQRYKCKDCGKYFFKENINLKQSVEISDPNKSEKSNTSIIDNIQICISGEELNFLSIDEFIEKFKSLMKKEIKEYDLIKFDSIDLKIDSIICKMYELQMTEEAIEMALFDQSQLIELIDNFSLDFSASSYENVFDEWNFVLKNRICNDLNLDIKDNPLNMFTKILSIISN